MILPLIGWFLEKFKRNFSKKCSRHLRFFCLVVPIDFRFKTLIPFLNQGQGSIFTVQECAQSIPRLEKRKNWRFSHKNPKIFRFSLQYIDSFPESGSRNRFKGSGMRAINSPHKITPKGSLVKKIKKNFFFEKMPTSLTVVNV
jgi:hypothetical protein